ncbi:MAG: DNRLRE domain-containing protein, partial [Mucilaginibacter sp.]
AAGGIAGISKSIVFTVINNYVNVVSLSPVADAFVRGGTTANTNYGNDPFLNVLGSSSATDTRYVYLKFDLEGIGNVTSATLRLYGKNITNTSRVSLSLYGVNSDSWNEGTINYNNAPNSLTGLLSAIAVTNTAKYNEFDILNFVKSQASGDKILTVMVKDSKNTGLNVVFNSRENVQNKPQLIINSGGQSFALLNNSPISVMEKSTKNLVPASVNNSLKVKLYPNPVHKILKLEFLQGFTSPPDLQIFDPSGKIYAIAKSLIKAGNSKSIEVNISTLLLKPGAYFLKISCAAKQLQVIKFLAE